MHSHRFSTSLWKLRSFSSASLISSRRRLLLRFCSAISFSFPSRRDADSRHFFMLCTHTWSSLSRFSHTTAGTFIASFKALSFSSSSSWWSSMYWAAALENGFVSSSSAKKSSILGVGIKSRFRDDWRREGSYTSSRREKQTSVWVGDDTPKSRNMSSCEVSCIVNESINEEGRLGGRGTPWKENVNSVAYCLNKMEQVCSTWKLR